MKNRRIIIVLLFLSLSCVSIIHAQHGACAADCYFPEVGKAGVIDTIYGGYSGQRLGSDVFWSGPTVSNSQGVMFVEGLRENAPFLSALSLAKPFNLHAHSLVNKTTFHRDSMITEFAHLRDTKHLDLIAINSNDRSDPRIYWSDDDGNYDNLRVTHLRIPARKDYIIILDNFNSGFPIHAHLTQDSVSDILLGVRYYNDSLKKRDNYIAFYKGGKNLYIQGDTVLVDSLELYEGTDDWDFHRDMVSGYWSGNGMEDLIGISPRGGDWFYFKNDSPFSLKKLVSSLKYDTLFTLWQNPKIKHQRGGKALRIFPKQAGDLSDDLLCGFDIGGTNGDASDYFFKGGKNFGSHRLFFDSVDFVFHTVRYYSNFFYGYFIESEYAAGDMTGTGNPCLITVAGDNTGRTFVFFYVMGTAMDDRVDMMYESTPYGGGIYDTLDANGDGKTDVLIGMPNYTTPEDLLAGKQSVGALHLVYGTKLIPVDEVNEPSFSSGGSIGVCPNPVHKIFTLSIPVMDVPSIDIILIDVLGRVAYRSQEEHMTQLQTSLRVELPELPNGTYLLQVAGGGRIYHTKVSIVN